MSSMYRSLPVVLVSFVLLGSCGGPNPTEEQKYQSTNQEQQTAVVAQNSATNEIAPSYNDFDAERIARSISASANTDLPEQDRKQFFARALNPILDSLINYVKLKNNLSQSESDLADRNLAKARAAMIDYYFSEFNYEMQQFKTFNTTSYTYEYPVYTPVHRFTSTVSQYGCFVLLNTVPFLVNMRGFGFGLSLFKEPCEKYGSDAISFVMSDVLDMAYFLDIAVIQETVTEQTRKTIIELGIKEDYLAFTDTVLYQSQIGPWLLNPLLNRDAIVIVDVESTVKAGFDLGSSFEVNISPADSQILITVPRPRVLSVEMNPTIKMVDDAWANRFDEEKINLFWHMTKQNIRATAIDNGIFEDAVKAVKNVLPAMFAQFTNGFHVPMKIKIDVDYAGSSRPPTSTPINFFTDNVSEWQQNLYATLRDCGCRKTYILDFIPIYSVTGNNTINDSFRASLNERYVDLFQETVKFGDNVPLRFQFISKEHSQLVRNWLWSDSFDASVPLEDGLSGFLPYDCFLDPTIKVSYTKRWELLSPNGADVSFDMGARVYRGSSRQPMWDGSYRVEKGRIKNASFIR